MTISSCKTLFKVNLSLCMTRWVRNVTRWSHTYVDIRQRCVSSATSRIMACKSFVRLHEGVFSRWPPPTGVIDHLAVATPLFIFSILVPVPLRPSGETASKALAIFSTFLLISTNDAVKIFAFIVSPTTKIWHFVNFFTHAWHSSCVVNIYSHPG